MRRERISRLLFTMERKGKCRCAVVLDNVGYYVAWCFRCGVSGLNRRLVGVLGVERTKVLLTKWYKKRVIDLDSPRKLNEKLLSAYYASDMDRMAQLADKYEVRGYIRQKGLEELLVPLYGVYDSVEQIDFDALPERFVLKATHGCDMNLICADKEQLSQSAARNKMRFWMRTNLAYMSLELHYAHIRPRMLCEQYLETDSDMMDYKFHCHNGNVLFVLVCSERKKGNYRDVFMPDWTHRPEAVVNAKCNPNKIQKPENYQKMLEIARVLSEDFPFVRVDLYEVQGKVYFGELTFTPATGVLSHFSDQFLLEQGQMWK